MCSSSALTEIDSESKQHIPFIKKKNRKKASERLLPCSVTRGKARDKDRERNRQSARRDRYCTDTKRDGNIDVHKLKVTNEKCKTWGHSTSEPA